jgi:hypothetical protein
MDDWQSRIGIAAGFFLILGFVPYLITIYQGKTQPNRATWWIWTIVGLIIVASYHSAGATNTIWLPVCAAVSHLIIAITALKYGKGGWSRFDRTCLLAVGLSLILWWRFNSPLLALWINIGIDFLGALPTIRKSFQEPETEAPLPWLIFLVASLLNLIAVKQSSLVLLAYPFYYFCSNAIILSLLLRSKLRIQLVRWKNQRKRKPCSNKAVYATRRTSAR